MSRPEPDTLRITPVVGGDAVWLRLEGDVERTTVLALSHALASVERGRPAVIGLEVSGVAFVDASGLHAFGAAAHRARVAGRRFVLANARGRFRRLLSVAGLDELVEVFPAAV